MPGMHVHMNSNITANECQLFETSICIKSLCPRVKHVENKLSWEEHSAETLRSNTSHLNPRVALDSTRHQPVKRKQSFLSEFQVNVYLLRSCITLACLLLEHEANDIIVPPLRKAWFQTSHLAQTFTLTPPIPHHGAVSIQGPEDQE